MSYPLPDIIKPSRKEEEREKQMKMLESIEKQLRELKESFSTLKSQLEKGR